MDNRTKLLRERIFWIAFVVLWVVVFLIGSHYAADARWKPEYAQNTPEERAWYDRQKTTPEFKKRVGLNWYNYCCSHADTVEAEFSKDGTSWQYRLPGTTEWKPLPQDVVEEDIPTPHGKPILFMDSTMRHLGPVCFFPGASDS